MRRQILFFVTLSILLIHDIHTIIVKTKFVSVVVVGSSTTTTTNGVNERNQQQLLHRQQRFNHDKDQYYCWNHNIVDNNRTFKCKKDYRNSNSNSNNKNKFNYINKKSHSQFNQSWIDTDDEDEDKEVIDNNRNSNKQGEEIVTVVGKQDTTMTSDIHVVTTDLFAWVRGKKGNDNNNDDYDASASTSTTDNDSLCRVYLAPSSIPGGGLGLFAGMYIQPNEYIINTTDLAVPIMDLDWHMSQQQDQEQQIHQKDQKDHKNNLHHSINHTSTDDDRPNNVNIPDLTRLETIIHDYVWEGHHFPWMTKPNDVDLMDKNVPNNNNNDDIVRNKVSSFSFGMGAIPNCYLSLVNVDHEWDDSLETVSRNMGRHRTGYNNNNNNKQSGGDGGIDHDVTTGQGAYTVFVGQKYKSHNDQPIVPGEELFLNYGPEYFTSRAHKFGNVPLPQHYRMADTILHRFRNVTKQMELSHKSPPYVTVTTSEEANNQQKYLKQETISQLQQKIKHDLYDTIVDIMATYRSRIYGALPSSLDSMDHILDQYGSTTMNLKSHTIRPVQWLKQVGSCTDHLFVADSSIVVHDHHDAGGGYVGQGAFANKFLKHNTVVAPVPILFIPDGKIMNMYDTYQKNGITYKNTSAIIHQQLFLNYCFGHQNTTVLLCPYGIASSAINHGPSVATTVSSSTTTPTQPTILTANVKLIWDRKLTTNPERLIRPLNEWIYSNQNTGFVLNYVALRDIQRGEEILFDYGMEWIHAWEQYQEQQQQQQHNFNQQLLGSDGNSILSRSASRNLFETLEYLNHQYTEGMIELSIYGQKHNNNNNTNDSSSSSSSSSTNTLWQKQHPDVHLWCYSLDTTADTQGIYKLQLCRIIGTSMIMSHATQKIEKIHAVEIVEHEYNATIQYRYYDENQTITEMVHGICTEYHSLVDFGVPENSIRFGTSYDYDVNLRRYEQPGTFRHYITLPDEILPPHWQNKYQG